MTAERAGRRPRRHPVEVELERYQNGQVSEEDMGVQLPADVPVRVRAFRLMEDVPKADGAKGTCTALKGWTVQLDAYAFGVKIYLRVGRDGSMKLFCEDKDGREKLVEWSND